MISATVVPLYPFSRNSLTQAVSIRFFAGRLALVIAMPSTPFLQLAFQILTAYTTTFFASLQDSLCSLIASAMYYTIFLQAKNPCFRKGNRDFQFIISPYSVSGRAGADCFGGLPSRSVSTPRPSGTATRPVMKLSPGTQ